MNFGAPFSESHSDKSSSQFFLVFIASYSQIVVLSVHTLSNHLRFPKWHILVVVLVPVLPKPSRREYETTMWCYWRRSSGVTEKSWKRIKLFGRKSTPGTRSFSGWRTSLEKSKNYGRERAGHGAKDEAADLVLSSFRQNVA